MGAHPDMGTKAGYARVLTIAAAIGLLGALTTCRGAGGVAPPPIVASSATSRIAVHSGAPAESAGASAAKVAPSAAGAAEPVHLEHPEALSRFFDALSELEAGRAERDVTILQFGASHTAADRLTGAVRSELQGRFGDGGRGFVALGRPWATKSPEKSVYLQEGVRGGMARPWAGERGKLVRGQFVGDGLYGLSGFAIQSPPRARATAFTEIAGPTSSFEIHYLRQPRGGTFDVMVDGAVVGHVATGARATATAARAFDVGEGSHRVEVRPRGDGTVRIFGLLLDRAERGVVLDALGINGARATVLLRWDEAHFAEQLRRRGPRLVVLSYGINESNDDTPRGEYEAQLARVIDRVAAAVPDAACLVLGPPDRAVRTPEGFRTPARLLDIIEAQRKVAEEKGCAFFDQFAAMGGEGTIAAWVAEPNPRAQADYVHYTRDGYVQQGRALAAELLRAYDAFRGEAAGERVASPLH